VAPEMATLNRQYEEQGPLVKETEHNGMGPQRDISSPAGKNRPSGLGGVAVSIVLASYCSHTQSPPGLGAINFPFWQEVKEEIALALSG
jgi:hypothetical protein